MNTHIHSAHSVWQNNAETNTPSECWVLAACNFYILVRVSNFTTLYGKLLSSTALSGDKWKHN